VAASAVQARSDRGAPRLAVPGPPAADDRGPRTGGAFRDAKIWQKIALILVVPLLAVLVLAGLRVAEAVRDASSAAETQQLARLGAQTTALVHELQKERSQTAAFLRDSNARPESLSAQLATTDAEARRFRGAVEDAPSGLPSALGSRISAARSQVDGLTSLRLDVANRRESLADTTTRYGLVIGSLLSVFEFLGADSDDQGLLREISTTAAFSRAKEFSSQEQVQLAGVLARPEKDREFGPGQYRDFVRTLADQEAAYAQFLASADADERDAAAETVSGVAVLEATRFENVAAQSAGGAPNILLGQWNTAMTTKIDLMRRVEQQLADDIVARTGELRASAFRQALGNGLLALLILLLALAISLLVARSLVRPLLQLRTAAHDVAYRSLPEVVQRFREQDARIPERGGPRIVEVRPEEIVQPVRVDSKDEIGEVARAFDEVHLEAVRVASEQATLRQNVSTMFVNLSRRSQLLVDRLIRQIDSLEQGENDPDRLSELFVLDHLATRMRRNDENLLVLAGAEVTRRWSEPALLADVLRAASAEVEQYARVEFGMVGGDVKVLGTAVNDVVHLVAELLENATTYSSPRTSVIVDARRVGDRAVIEIEDRGIGMSPEQLGELNRRLMEQQDVDVSVSRMMGLFVVSRLARRHGISVQLRPSSGGGVLALVTLPPSVLTETPVDDRAAHRTGDVRGGDGAAAAETATAPRLTDPATTGTYRRETETGEPARPALPGPATPAAPARGAPAAGSAASVEGTPAAGPAVQGSGAPPGPGSQAPGGRGSGVPAAPGSELPAAPGAAGDGAPPPPEPARHLNGAAAAALLPLTDPAPARDGSPAEDDTLPLRIFESVESEWFRAHPGGEQLMRPTVGEPADGTAGVTPAPAAASAGAARPAGPSETETPGDRAKEQPATTWRSPADQGWVAASSAATPTTDGRTRTGLPRRVPMAQLVPGGVESRPAPRTPGGPGSAPPVRSADAIRGTLSSYHRGADQGRQAGRSGQAPAGGDGGRPPEGAAGSGAAAPRRPAAPRRGPGSGDGPPPPPRRPGSAERAGAGRPGADRAGAERPGVSRPGADRTAPHRSTPGGAADPPGPPPAPLPGAGAAQPGAPAGPDAPPPPGSGPPARPRLPQRTPGSHQPEVLRDSRPPQDPVPPRRDAARRGQAPHEQEDQ